MLLLFSRNFIAFSFSELFNSGSSTSFSYSNVLQNRQRPSKLESNLDVSQCLQKVVFTFNIKSSPQIKRAHLMADSLVYYWASSSALRASSSARRCSYCSNFFSKSVTSESLLSPDLIAHSVSEIAP